MILVKLSRAIYEYDIHSLIKAFYPGQEVSVTAEDKEYGEPAVLLMWITYLEDAVRIEWKERGGVHAPGGEAEETSAPGGGGEAEETSAPGREAEEASTPGGGGDSESRNAGEGYICLEGVEFAVDFSDRLETKNRLKRNLYRLLSRHTGIELPWGALTGIRPVKIPMKLLKEGKSREEIRRYMGETYYTSPKKADLAADIAERELEILSKIDYKNGYSLYIGIPFCPTTCLYCSFTSFPLAAWHDRVDEYLDALDQEMDCTAEICARKKLNSVYVGGGTPTSLSPAQLDRLIRKIKGSFDLSDCLEFTVEAGRPDSITAEKLAVLREYGISRISVNPQTMKQETLDLIGRRHTVGQAVEGFRLAREFGFDNINMDLIMGLPDETLSDVKDTLEQIKALAPDSLTVHSLATKRASRLNILKEDYKNYRMVNTQEHMDLAASYAAEMGLVPYYLYRQKGMAGNLENVGYAKPGKAGAYNVLVMEEVQTIMALGAGGISKRAYPDGSVKRCANVKDVAQYIARIGEMADRKRVLFGE